MTRKVDSWEDGAGLIISEKIKAPNSRRWDEDRVYLTREELAKLAAKYPLTKEGELK